MRGLYVLSETALPLIYGEREQQEIASLIDIVHPLLTAGQVREKPEVLRDVEVVMSGWGGPLLDERFLTHANRLKAVFYGAGSLRTMLTDAFWERDIVITSSWAANALPVAEFTEAAIVLSLKRVWHLAEEVRREHTFSVRRGHTIPGAYGATVGVVSLGKIGRLVCLRLLSHDLDILAHDPYVSEEYARQMGVRLCGLEEMFAVCDVVSLHAPLLPETRGMIRGAHLRAMKRDATFINTARGALVNEEEMIEALRERPDLRVVLDVTWPEPPPPDSPLYDLPNVTLTPHVAGSQGPECRRMGRYAIEELKRFLKGEPLRWRVTKETARIMA